MFEVEWKDPPAKKGGGSKGAPQRGKGYELTQVLKANPGRWAFYGTFKSSRTAGQLTDMYGVETTLRANDDGAWDVYARWGEEA